MKQVLRRKPSASMVVALIALCVAASGTAIAASKLVKGDKLIAKKSLSGNRLRNHTITGKQVNLQKLGTVPRAATARHATDAATIGGRSPAAFFPAGKVRTFNVKLAFDESRTLFSVGTLTFSATCQQNAADPGSVTHQDFVALRVETSQNGAIFSAGNSGGMHGTGPLDFLNAGAPEALAWNSQPTGASYGGIENNGGGYGMDAVDPNGVAVIFPDGVTGAVNLFGSNCMLAGFAVIP